jgi:hypothetical protein
VNKQHDLAITDDVPEVIRTDVEKARKVLKKFGCREIYLCNSAHPAAHKGKPEIDLGVKGLEPQIFFHAYGELCFELEHKVRLSDFGTHKRRFDFLVQEGECIRVG